MSSSPVFTNLLAPHSVADFFQTHWEQAPLHLARADAGYHAEVLTLAELDRYWQSHNLHPAFLKVIRDGVPVPPERWTTLEKRQQTEPYRVVALAKLFARFNEGASIVFSAAEAGLPGLMAYCQRLAGELLARVQANIYLTPPHAQAVPPHFDTHNLFVLQISGSKHWRLYDRPVIAPVQDQDVAAAYTDKTPAQELTLQPGDLLYVPRGLVHAASTGATAALHVTLGIHGGYGFHLLEELAALAQADPCFRQTLPLGVASADARAAWLAAFAGRLQSFVAAQDLAGLLARRQAALAAAQPAAQPGRLLDMLQADQLTPATRVVRRASVVCELTREPSGLRLRCGERELSFPFFLAPALEALLNGAPQSINDIGGLLSPHGKLEVARELLRAGLLTIVHD